MAYEVKKMTDTWHRLAVFLLVMFALTACDSSSNGDNSVGQDIMVGAEHEFFTFRGADSARLGESIADIGDVDNDGYTDLVIGAPQIDSAGGYVSVQSGLDGRRLFSVTGEADGDAFGISVSAAGDVNADGVPDILAGAMFGGPGGNGYVKVLSGVDGEVLQLFAEPSPDIQEFGWRVNGPGDLNGDGDPDILVGTIKDSSTGVTEAGMVRAYSGRTGELLYAYSGNGIFRHLGQSISGAGDVNLDGHADFLMGSPIGNSPEVDAVGLVSVVSGTDGEILFTIYGPNQGGGIPASSRFGRSVSDAGDINEDGFPDFVVGAITDASGGDRAGKFYLFSGLDGSEIMSFAGEPGQLLGESVSGAGDIDGDGIADIVSVGTLGGQVRSGKTGNLLYELPTLVPAASSADGAIPEVKSFGQVSFSSDVNGDGHDELLLGMPLDSANGQLSGKALLLSGAAISAGDGFVPPDFIDEFDDDTFPDGRDGRAVNYLSSCAISDESEQGGTLQIGGPVEGCDNTTQLFTSNTAAGELTITLSVNLDGMPMGPGAGITTVLANNDGSEIGAMALFRAGNAVILTLGDEAALAAEAMEQSPQLAELAVITNDINSYDVPDTLDIRLELVEQDGGLVAHGSYREQRGSEVTAFIPLPSTGNPQTEFLLGDAHRLGVVGANLDAGEAYAFEIDALTIEYLN
ncbi:MAG: hypothetical protein ACR2P1_27865 [Pseudomonadales bacterium]